MRLLIFALLVMGGFFFGAAFRTPDADAAMILGSLGLSTTWAGAWLLATRVDRRRG